MSTRESRGARVGRPRDFSVVVTGLPRSGTSLAMQMLAAGGVPPCCDGRRAPDAANPRGYFEHAAAREPARLAGLARAARGRALKLVAPAVQALPADSSLRFVWMRREPHAVLASQQALLVARAAAAPHVDTTRERAALEGALAALEAWLRANAAGRWLRLDYEQVLAAPLEAAERLAELVEGLDVAAAAAAVDASLRRSG